MESTTGNTITAQLADPPGGVTALGARIEVPYTRAVASYWRPAVLGSDGVWTVSLESPVGPGDYLFVWRNNTDPVSYEVFLPLRVADAGSVPTGSFPEVDRDSVRPTVEDVSNLERTRAVAEGGAEVDEFRDDTQPSVTDVEELIDTATTLVLSELPNEFPASYYESVKHAVTLYTAMLVEGSFFREEEGQGSAGLWRTLYNTAILNVKAQMEVDLANARRPTRLEAWRPDPLILR